MSSHVLSPNGQTEEANVSPLGSPITVPFHIHLVNSGTTEQQLPLPPPSVFVDSSTIVVETNASSMVKNMQQAMPPSKAQTPLTPTTVNMMKRPRESFASLQKLESNQLELLEGTLQEINKTSSNGSSGRRRRRKNAKSPTEWSMNSSIPENGEDLSGLRQELDRAESVYSRKTADATFGDESSDEDEALIVGSFLPISSFEEYKEDDPAAPLTNHVPSPMRVNTTTIHNGVPNIPNIATPQSQSMLSQIQHSTSHPSFQHIMETVSEEKIIGTNVQLPTTVTPSKTKQPEDESTQETSPESNAVPHEVFVPKGSSGSTSGIRTVVSQTTFEADVPPSTPKSRVSAVHTAPVDARGWATVAEPRHSAPRRAAVRRHSSFSLMAHSPASYLKSAQSPVHDLVKKQERKRAHLKATIDSVRNKNYSVDSRLLQALTDRENLKREVEAEKVAHKETVTSLTNKIRFLKRQHELQTEQQEGVNGLTKTHNKFLKEQFEQLQEEYERLKKKHKQETARLAEKPEALYEQIKMLEQGKKLLLGKHEQELTSKQMEYESLESKLKNLREQHRRHEKSLQEELDDEHHKIKKLQDRVVELETVELTIAKQKILVLQDQLETARHERQDLVSQHRTALMRNDEKYAALVQQHESVTQASHQEISALKHQVSELQANMEQLEMLRANELEEHRTLEQKLSESRNQEQESTEQKSSIQSNYEKLESTLQRVQQERDSLLQNQKDQTQTQEQMKLSFLQKVACLEDECSRLQSTLDEGIASQTSEIAKLRGKLDLAESEWQDQQATNLELVAQISAMEEELDKAANANVMLARNMLRDLAFGL